MKRKGCFITFEGAEGSGKSTQIAMALRYLKAQKKEVVFLREPGGVNISEMIRNILLDVKNEGMGDECEMLLYMAARAQLVKEKILPALTEGKVVLCDRYIDSTIAYQGYGNGIDIKAIRDTGKFATQGIMPDLTIVFDIDTTMGLGRIKRTKDRIERRETAYHDRVREGYLKIAHQEPRRVKVVNANQSLAQIHDEVKGHLNHLIKKGS